MKPNLKPSTKTERGCNNGAGLIVAGIVLLYVIAAVLG